MHSCPAVSPAPHVGGPVTGPGCATVLIGGMPAATAGDACACTGPPDVIVAGSSGVLIGGKPAARMGDATAHGGVIVGGCGTVLIGEKIGRTLFQKPDIDGDGDDDFVMPSEAEKVAILQQAIQDCIALLEVKLRLLKNNDPKTLTQFKKWFGTDSEAARKIILKRISKTLNACTKLSRCSFDDKVLENEQIQLYAEIMIYKESFTVFLGKSFWKAPLTGKDSRAGTLVHELSHLRNVGKTEDYVYGNVCELLAKCDPDAALFNADNFEYFVVS
jgi:uncharacterized Zn-binding protein involved in type VI secretion